MVTQPKSSKLYHSFICQVNNSVVIEHVDDIKVIDWIFQVVVTRRRRNEELFSHFRNKPTLFCIFKLLMAENEFSSFKLLSDCAVLHAV
jgi:hypothetical protein